MVEAWGGVRRKQRAEQVVGRQRGEVGVHLVADAHACRQAEPGNRKPGALGVRLGRRQVAQAQGMPQQCLLGLLEFTLLPVGVQQPGTQRQCRQQHHAQKRGDHQADGQLDQCLNRPAFPGGSKP